MKFPWTLVVLMMVAGTTLANRPTTSTNNTSEFGTFSELQVKERLAQLNLPINVVSNAQVMTRIRQYVTAGRNETEVILGRTVVYFPIFEHYLQKYKLPKELKYLPMIESGLRPTVKSGVGAAGMWQLMPITARYNGLLVDQQVDQRLDPYASTEAAVKMLDFLYRQFGDWGLVLAAYNSGHGRVKKAIKLAGGSKDYWTVKQYLPKETQKYVPAFIAAAYVAQYYSSHDLQPVLSTKMTLAQDTRLIQLTQGISFNQIAQATGLSLSTIKTLNPAYIQSRIPAYKNGHNVVLPSSSIASLRNYLAGKSTAVLAKPSSQVETVYVVAKGDDLNKIAKKFNTTVEAIKGWNKLSQDSVHMNQELVLYLSRSYLMKRA